jgi:hypothetical protein
MKRLIEVHFDLYRWVLGRPIAGHITQGLEHDCLKRYGDRHAVEVLVEAPKLSRLCI